MKNKLSLLLPAAALLFAALWLSACQKEDIKTEATATTSQVDERTNGNSAVYPPTAHPYSKSYAAWSAIWWQKFLTYDCASTPFANPSNVLFNQSGQVYFLAGLAEVGTSVSVTIPHGKAVLFPLVNFINFPCGEYQPGPNQTMEEFLTQDVQTTLYETAVLSVTIDGVEVNNPGSYGFTSSLFNFTGNADLANCFTECITGLLQPAVAAGYFMMLKPLSKGEHTVHYIAEIPAYGIAQDGTFNITVQ